MKEDVCDVRPLPRVSWEAGKASLFFTIFLKVFLIHSLRCTSQLSRSPEILGLFLKALALAFMDCMNIHLLKIMEKG